MSDLQRVSVGATVRLGMVLGAVCAVRASAGEAVVFDDRSAFMGAVDVVAVEGFESVFAPDAKFGGRNFGAAAFFPPFTFRGEGGADVVAFTAEFHSGSGAALSASHFPVDTGSLLVERDGVYASFGMDLLVRTAGSLAAASYEVTLLRGGDAVWVGEAAPDSFVGVTLADGFDGVRVVGTLSSGVVAAVEMVDGVVVGDAVPVGCNVADLVEPYGVLDLADINAFVSAFLGGAGDLNGDGVLDLSDINLFVGSFAGGCG